MRRKTSPIWKIEKAELINIVNQCNSFSEILKSFGLINKGGNYRTLKQRLIFDKIDFSTIVEAARHRKPSVGVTATPLEEILVEHCPRSRTGIKHRIVRANILKYECEICKIGPTWQRKKLSLVLDHINGVYDDYRIKNLRFLCPNCNSQTDTFAGKKNKIFDTTICACGNPTKNRRQRYCDKCRFRSQAKFWKRKVVRPNYEVLLKESKQMSFVSLGKKYGVSDNAVRKWLRYYEKCKELGILA